MTASLTYRMDMMETVLDEEYVTETEGDDGDGGWDGGEVAAGTWEPDRHGDDDDGGKPRTEMPPHKVLREVLRNYLSYRDHLAFHGGDVIEHSYEVPEPDGTKRKVTLTVSFSDLQDLLLPQSKGGILSERKREALLYNVVFDWRQQDVAEKMGITPVSVGQYADLALRQLAKRYFTAEDLALSKFDYGKAK